MAAAGPARCSSRAAAGPAPTCSTSSARRRSAGTARGRRIVVAAWTRGSRERLANLLREHGFKDAAQEDDWAAVRRRPAGSVSLVTLGVERGFVADQLALVGEQDLLGERISRPPRRRKRADQFIAEATEIAEGDLVVHQEYGIGRYDGLETLTVTGAPHDCLRLIYDGDEKLFLPVENIEVLSRFGSETQGVALDKLGGVAWQTRKARMKQRIRDMADELIRIAAARQIRDAAIMAPGEGAWDEFCARFPFAETEDQARAIADVLEDLASGRPMDRLICGDVGFGKTEVALRAAFVAAMSGAQVAVVVPTTLLARQHFRTFSERFAGLPVKVAQLSRMVPAKEAAEVRRGITDGSVNIVIGTHALLAKSVEFADLGLLVVDEEQHFGVAHKERLKQLKADVHVLTLTATPIPRTLQLALTGVREMSLIATPPVDRLAVRTFIMPFDAVVIREALQRERFRGGQVFCVVPRIEDLPRMAERLTRDRARGAHRAGAWPAGADRARTGDDRVRRRPLRHPAVHQHRRKRSRHAGGEHAGDPSRRHVRARPALPVARPRRARQAARLRLSDLAAESAAVGGGGEAADGDADAGCAGRGLHAGHPRPRYPRRRQSAGRRTVRPYPRGRHRAVSADAGRRGGRAARRRGPSRRTGTRLDAEHQARAAGADPGGLRARPAGAAWSVSPHRRAGVGRGDRGDGGGTGGSLRHRCRRRWRTCCRLSR